MNEATTTEQARKMVDIVQHWFSYDPKTGVVSWKRKPNRNIPVGREAGFRWSDGTNTYTRITVEGRQVFAHVVAVVIVTGAMPTNPIDHQNGNGTDNSWNNLRVVTHTENLRNQRLNSRNSSGVMGVSLASGSNRWRARIIVDKKERALGCFGTKEEAILARKAAERQFNFHQNHGRST